MHLTGLEYIKKQNGKDRDNSTLIDSIPHFKRIKLDKKINKNTEDFNIINQLNPYKLYIEHFIP